MLLWVVDNSLSLWDMGNALLKASSSLEIPIVMFAIGLLGLCILFNLLLNIGFAPPSGPVPHSLCWSRGGCIPPTAVDGPLRYGIADAKTEHYGCGCCDSCAFVLHNFDLVRSACISMVLLLINWFTRSPLIGPLLWPPYFVEKAIEAGWYPDSLGGNKSGCLGEPPKMLAVWGFDFESSCILCA